jgi:hypothetical protein
MMENVQTGEQELARPFLNEELCCKLVVIAGQRELRRERVLWKIYVLSADIFSNGQIIGRCTIVDYGLGRTAHGKNRAEDSEST